MASTLTRPSTHRAAAAVVARRQLHMTLPAPAPSAWLVAGLQESRYLPRAFADLQAECRQRRLSALGSKTELANRLRGDDVARSRSYITATPAGTSKRPTASQTRAFNTTRALKSPKDSSTIDFAFLPNIEYATHANPGMPTPTFAAPFSSTAAQQPPIAVPFLPSAPVAGKSPAAVSVASMAAAADVVAEVFRPEISTVAGASTHLNGAPSAMDDVLDNATIAFDPSSSSSSSATVNSASVSQSGVGAESGTVKGEMRRFWNGLVEDVLGADPSPSKAVKT